MHLTKMMATIFIVFALSYFPCTISSIVDWNTVLSKRFHMFCLITVYMGSAVNPLIYGMMNSQFRLAYYTILLCRYCYPTEKPTSSKLTSLGSPLIRHKKHTSVVTRSQDTQNRSNQRNQTKEELVKDNEQTKMSTELIEYINSKSDEKNQVIEIEDDTSDFHEIAFLKGSLHRSETEKTYLE